MPSINFILPHWLYWGTIVVFPLIRHGHGAAHANAGLLAARSAIMILVTGGLLGLHRLYLRNLWGLIYLPLFFAILCCQRAGPRRARAAIGGVQCGQERPAGDRTARNRRSDGADDKIAELRAELAEAEEGSFAEIRAEKMLEKAATGSEDAERLEKARADLRRPQPTLDRRAGERDASGPTSPSALPAICALMAIDAVLLPGHGAQARRPGSRPSGPRTGCLEAAEHRPKRRPKRSRRRGAATYSAPAGPGRSTGCPITRANSSATGW